MKRKIATTMGERRCSRCYYWITTLLISTALLGGCGGGSGSGAVGIDTDPVVPTDPTVAETLEALNIPTAEQPLKDEFDNTIPDDYSPLGPRFELNGVSELVVLGLQTSNNPAPITLWDLENSNTQLLKSFDGINFSWARETGWGSMQTQRTGIGADLDGDCRDEQVYVHRINVSVWVFTIIEDAEHGYERTIGGYVASPWEIDHVSIATADINGDGDEEILLGISSLGQAQLYVYDCNEDGYLVPQFQKTFTSQHQGDILRLEIASGNIDYDPEDEVGVVVNEGFSWGIVGCDSYVLDVEGAAFSVQYAGAIAADGYLAECGDVAMGDLDADGMDEIVFAGCPRPSVINHVLYALISLDDAIHDFKQDSRAREYIVEGNGTQVYVNTPQVGLVDLEGDHACEVHVNNLVFPDWKTHDPWSNPFELDDCYLPGRVQEWNSATHAFAVGNFTGRDPEPDPKERTKPSRQDLAVVARGFSKVSIWGIADPSTEIRVLKEIPLKDFSENSDVVHPRLISINSDIDGTTLEFVERKYVMTEPSILAVMAAAPSITGPGQNKEANLTEFGTKHGSGSGGEGHFTFTAGVIVGAEIEGASSGFDFEVDLGFELEKTAFTNSSVSFGAAYGSAWQTDTVVCTSVPYDIYCYCVLQDPDPDLIGNIMEINVPRTPVTGIHDIDFYNASVDSEAVRIGDDVLRHTIGNPHSYPTRQDRDKLIRDEYGNLIGLYDNKLESAGGPPGGHVSRDINVISESGHTLYTGGTYNFSCKTTLTGFKLGGRFGFGGGHTWSWTVENENNYIGTVGSVDEALYPDQVFSWGLFCYWQTDPDSGQQYQVINYWVE